MKGNVERHTCTSFMWFPSHRGITDETANIVCTALTTTKFFFIGSNFLLSIIKIENQKQTGTTTFCKILDTIIFIFPF